MLTRKRVIFMILPVLLLVAVAIGAAAGDVVDQKSTLSGKVLPDRLVVNGASVREGDVLVVVDGITGAAPAARATTDGIVRDVFVKSGDMIHTGDVLVRIESVRK